MPNRAILNVKMKIDKEVNLILKEHYTHLYLHIKTLHMHTKQKEQCTIFWPQLVYRFPSKSRQKIYKAIHISFTEASVFIESFIFNSQYTGIKYRKITFILKRQTRIGGKNERQIHAALTKKSRNTRDYGILEGQKLSFTLQHADQTPPPPSKVCLVHTVS